MLERKDDLGLFREPSRRPIDLSTPNLHFDLFSIFHPPHYTHSVHGLGGGPPSQLTLPRTEEASIRAGSEVHAEQGERERRAEQPSEGTQGGRCEQRARMTIPGKPDDE